MLALTSTTIRIAAASAAPPVAKDKRPQTPHPPFPYASSEVRFEDADAHRTVVGTLSLPEKDAPYPGFRRPGCHTRGPKATATAAEFRAARRNPPNSAAIARRQEQIRIGEKENHFIQASGGSGQRRIASARSAAVLSGAGGNPAGPREQNAHRRACS